MRTWILLLLAGFALYLLGFSCGRCVPDPLAADAGTADEAPLTPGAGSTRSPISASPWPEASDYSERVLDAIELGRQEGLEALIKQFDLSQIQSTAAEISKLPYSERSAALYVLLPRWTQLDPNGALRYAFGVQKTARSTRGHYIGLVIQEWAKIDPGAAEKTLDQVADKTMQAYGRQFLALALAANEPARALELLRKSTPMRGDNLPRRFGDENVRAILTAVAEIDPAAAAAVAAQAANAKDMLTAVAEGWAKKDPHAAFTWVQTLGPDCDRYTIFTAIAQEWAKVDPAEATKALSTVKELAEAPSQLDLGSVPPLKIALRRWAQTDWSKALEWIMSMPSQHDSGLSIRARYMELAGEEIGEQNPLAFLSALKKGADLEGQISNAVRSWCKSDPKSAADWVRQQTDPKLKGPLWEKIVLQALERDPQEALRLAEGLEPDTRQNVLDKLVDSWSSKGPAAALDWILGSPKVKSGASR